MMFKHKHILSILLLAVYAIVFGHSIVPHHHHYQSVCADEVEFQSETYNQEGHIHTASCHHHGNEQSELNHHHHDDEHNACDFEVTPLVLNGLSIALVYLPSIIEEIRVSEVQIKSILPQYTPHKLLEGYDFAVPLRAPPYFS